MTIKPFILTICLFFASISTFGQNSKFELGLEFGPNLHMRTSHYPNYQFYDGQKSPALGLTVIPSFQYNFHRIFSLRIGLGYQSFSEKIFNIDSYPSIGLNTTPIGKSNHYDTYHTAQIPTQLRATFGKKNHFFINAGTSLSILTNRTRYTDFVASPENVQTPSYNKHQTVHSFDIYLGAMMGMGVSVPVRKKIQFSIEARATTTMLRYNDLSRLFSPFRQRLDFTPTLLFGVSYKI